jgi:hypothetical protein
MVAQKERRFPQRDHHSAAPSSPLSRSMLTRSPAALVYAYAFLLFNAYPSKGVRNFRLGHRVRPFLGRALREQGKLLTPLRHTF